MLARAVAIFVVFIAAAGILARAHEAEPVMARTTFDRFPMQIAEWSGIQQPPLDERTLEVLGADDYVNRAYVTPDRAGVGLFVAFYQSQRQGDTMHSPLNCLPGSGWEAVSRTTLGIPLSSAAGEPESKIFVNRYVIQKGLDKQLVLYWYQSHGRVVASEYWGKYYLISDSVRLHRTDGALVRVVVPILPGEDADAAAERIGVRFVQSLFPVLPEYVPL